MARWDSGGVRIATTLFEAAAFHKTVQVECRCGRVEVLHAHALWWLFEQKGWDGRLKAVAARLRCASCDRRGCSISLVQEVVTVSTLPLPSEQDWKRAVSRFRS